MRENHQRSIQINSFLEMGFNEAVFFLINMLEKNTLNP
jgi:hypothetical protein